MKKLALLAASLALIATTSLHAAEAKTNWDKSCAVCHGPEGKGKPAMKTKDYTSAEVQSAITDEAVFKAIKEGFTTSEGKKVMKPYDKLTDDEIKALVAYMRAMKK